MSAGPSLEAPYEVKSLAALIFKDNEAANEIVSDFAAGLKSRGHRIAGLIQAVDVGAALRLPGSPSSRRRNRRGDFDPAGSREWSQSCRIDTAALADAAHRVARALASAPELLFVNRFGKLEADGLGLYAEIGAAAAAGIPTLVCVSMKFIDPWRRFTMGLDEELPCSGAALERWWARSRGEAPPET